MIAILGPGEVIGIRQSINNEAWQFIIKAQNDCTMMKISGDVFKAYLSESYNLQEFVRKHIK